MKDTESTNESKAASIAQVEPGPADRRAFIKTAVKTIVAGTAVVGIAGSVGKAEAATGVTGTCGGPLEVPRDAVVKARVLLNNHMAIKRQDIIDVVGAIFDGSGCPTCGLGGYPGPIDPGIVIEISLETAFLQKDQPSAVIFTEASGGRF